MATTEQKIKSNAYKESILKNRADSNGTVIGESTTPRPTGPVGTNQIGSAGFDVGTGAVAGIQQNPNFMNKATPSVNATKQAGESLVGTGAIAGMPDNYVNFNDVADVFEQKSGADVNVLRNGQPKNDNAVIPSVEQPTTSAGTPTVSTTSNGVRKAVVNNGPQLKNADVNLSQYGDDSSAVNYNNPNLVGGENDKYTGENTLNSNVAYDPNATLEGLDPNYQYGWNAQLANSNEAGYIARRNDQIASALYNAGLTSLDDVANYLYKQEGFLNSNENERRNTLASIYKRLGQIKWNASSDGVANENNEDGNVGVDNSSTADKMQADLLQSTAGEIYGKNTADVNGEDRAIKTLQDQYNVEMAVNKQRVTNFKNLQTLDSKDIATSIIFGTTPYGEQGMRDLMQYDPQKYQEVQNYIKEMKSQKTVNSLTSDGSYSVDTNGNETIESDLENWAKQNATDGNYKEIISNVKDELASNETATTAQKEMNNLSADIAKLQTKIKNLDREAKAAFKSDVPQYLVNAYKANKQLEYQDKISELESRYNTALNLYKTELSNTQWNAEFGLKQQQLAMQQQSQNFDQWYKKQTLQNSSIFKDSSGTNWQLKQGTDGNLYYEKIENVSSYTASGMKGAGLRNNNPGNIKDTGFGNVLGTDSRGFAMFATPEDGFDALVAKIENVQRGGSKTYSANMSLYDFFSKYAPSSDNNNPKAYAESVAKQLGTTANATVGSVDPTAFAAAIAKHDSGYDYSTYGQFRGGAVVGGGSQDTSGVFNRRDGEIFNTLNAPTFNSLSYDKQNTVKGLLNLTINPATITKRQYGDDFESILSAVQEINPSWSSADYGQADKAKKEWNTSSKNGSNSRNATAMATAKEVWEMADTIGNTTFKDWNSMLNKIRSKVSDTDYIRLQVNLQTMASEFAGALKGGNAAPTKEEISDAKELISNSFSNGGIRAAAEQIARQLYNKNVTEADNYRNVTLEKPNSPWIGDVPEWMYENAGIDISDYYNYKNPNAIDLSGLQELANMLNF